MAFVPGSQAFAALERILRGPGANAGRGGGQAATQQKRATRHKWPSAVPIVPAALAITVTLAIAVLALVQTPAPTSTPAILADARSITVKELYLGGGARSAVAQIYASY